MDPQNYQMLVVSGGIQGSMDCSKGQSQGGGGTWIPDIGLGGGGEPLGGRNFFCDPLYKSSASKPNSASKEVGKFRCTTNT